MWFDSWPDLLRTVLVGGAAYFTLVLVLRLTGKRTLAQLNAFDFVVTVAFGSTLATILLSADVSWAEGAVAFGVLAALQLLVAVIASHWPRFRRAVTAEPEVLLLHGRMDPAALRRHRMTESEVRQAVRQTGRGALGDVAAVVLETNGTLSVIGAQDWGDASALQGLELPHDGDRERPGTG
ncbi:YetF domain-containing protein [Zhihengliuella sp.]|uniref:DUF421 domain-containing protein n=1 Tax=Zhihengliuella sp. TaxID=1954483 RepID=UPI0028112AAD|nr:YetF domain-containing protein [Zhihengliuella sp.]